MAALPATAAAATCSYDDTTRTAAASVTGETGAISVGVLGQIQLNGLPCETATVTTTDHVTVTGSPGTTETVVVDLTGGPFEPGFTPEATGRSEIEFAVATGGDQGDRLRIEATGGPDVIRMGGEGVDLNADDDVDVEPLGVAVIEIRGGDGADRILGGPPDLPLDLDGQSGDDELTGGSADDALDGGEGDDALDGGGGDDDLAGGGGEDLVHFEDAPGRVVVDLGLGSATGSGRDTLSGVEEVRGTPGPDRILGDQGPNTLAGGPGNDRLGGTDGDDLLDAGPGKDFVRPGRGDDRVVGSEGSDTCSFRGAGSPVKVNLQAGTSLGQGRDLLSGVESAVGSAFDDAIRGTNASNRRLVGGRGDDRLVGRGGPDRLRGGPGADVLSGGGGDDDLAAGGGDDTLRGDRGDDVLSGGRGRDTCVSDEGHDRTPGCERAGRA